MAQETPESPGSPGEGAGAAIPVVFFHGQPGFGSDFDPVRRLLGSPFLVMAPDRPGYGENPLPSTSMQANADWFAAQLEAASASHDIGPAILVGHSFGGGIAALLAAERPDLVAGVVLAASVGSGEHLGALDRALATPVLGEVLFAGGLGAAGTLLPFIRSRSAIAPDRIARWLSVSLPDRGFLRETSNVARMAFGGRRAASAVQGDRKCREGDSPPPLPRGRRGGHLGHRGPSVGGCQDRVLDPRELSF